MGFAGIAMGSILARHGSARADSPAPGHGTAPHFKPRAKSVIWVFLSGGYSHLETFDPKPALNRHAGKTFDKLPLPNQIGRAHV